jgi:hypothetical protein
MGRRQCMGRKVLAGTGRQVLGSSWPRSCLLCKGQEVNSSTCRSWLLRSTCRSWFRRSQTQEGPRRIPHKGLALQWRTSLRRAGRPTRPRPLPNRRGHARHSRHIQAMAQAALGGLRQPLLRQPFRRSLPAPHLQPQGGQGRKLCQVRPGRRGRKLRRLSAGRQPAKEAQGRLAARATGSGTGAASAPSTSAPC